MAERSNAAHGLEFTAQLAGVLACPLVLLVLLVPYRRPLPREGTTPTA